MAESLDPVIYEEFFGIRQEGIEYLKIILQKNNYDNATIDKIVDSLTLILPTHGFVIDRDLAKQIGLNIEYDNKNSDVWNKMRKWFAKYVIEESDRHFIRYCIPSNSKKK